MLRVRIVLFPCLCFCGPHGQVVLRCVISGQLSEMPLNSADVRRTEHAYYNPIVNTCLLVQKPTGLIGVWAAMVRDAINIRYSF